MSVAQCRCGKPRPEPGETLAGGAEALAKLRPAEPRTDWSWVPKVLGLLVIVALYFGSRMLNRYNASKEAHRAAVDSLGQVLDKQQASDMVRRHHDQCFDQHYKTGWGRRQGSSFETEKYAKCVLDKVMADLDRENRALRNAAAPAPRPARATPAPTSTPAPATHPDWGPVTLGDVKVIEFKRSPQLTFGVEFIALAPRLTPRASCLFQVNCEEQPPGRNLVVGCTLRVDGPKAAGSLRHVYDVAGPPKASCSLSLQLSDGYSTRSNTVVVPLR